VVEEKLALMEELRNMISPISPPRRHKLSLLLQDRRVSSESALFVLTYHMRSTHLV
jgi:hypothetical protein